MEIRISKKRVAFFMRVRNQNLWQKTKLIRVWVICLKCKSWHKALLDACDRLHQNKNMLNNFNVFKKRKQKKNKWNEKLGRIDQTIVQNKRRHKMKEKRDQKSRTSHINSISCPNPHVSFSIINFSFWLCMVTKRVYRDQKTPEKDIIAEVEIMAWI